MAWSKARSSATIHDRERDIDVASASDVNEVTSGMIEKLCLAKGRLMTVRLGS
jgi:hypothetical protein